MSNYATPLSSEGQIHVAGKTLACLVCGGTNFVRREVNMNTKGMSFLGLDWLNKSGDGAICSACGYVHIFMANAHMWQVPQAD